MGTALRWWPAHCPSEPTSPRTPGDHEREDLHPPDCGERRGRQVRLQPHLRPPHLLTVPAPSTPLCSRDAIAKVLYALLFSWLIARVNALVSPQKDALSIAVLDIYGFEVGLRGKARVPSTVQGPPPLLSPSIHPQALPGASGCQALWVTPGSPERTRPGRYPWGASTRDWVGFQWTDVDKHMWSEP